MKALLARILEATLARAEREGALPAWGGRPAALATIDVPRSEAHGDFATNLALLYAKPAGLPPREVAVRLKDRLVDPEGAIASVEIAGPGFLNFRLAPEVWWRGLAEVAARGAAFGRSDLGGGARVDVEFVSANPTGPMHVGHGRGAVTGDAIAALLSATGHEVTREYYVNDAGAQVKILARSVHLRYRELFGEAVVFPEESYPGAYVADVAKRLRDAHGDRFLGAPEEAWLPLFSETAVEHVLSLIREDLDGLGIRFDVWTSERKALRDSGELAEVLGDFRRRGLVYDQDGAVFYRSTRHGDDKDRPVVKSSGEPTYLAGDIAYHRDKFRRGFAWCLDVWGADHHGDIPRVKAAVADLGIDPARLRFTLVQMVNLLRDGKPVKMSKRAGTVVSLREIVSEVGRDATRFFFLLRRGDAQLDFDVGLAKRQSDENPVFYVQYGHARLCSILRRAREAGLPPPAHDLAALRALDLPEELSLARRVLALPELVAGAATALEPHRLVFWLQETVAAFHGYYTKHRTTEKVIGPDPVKTRARLFLCDCLRQAVANTLGLLGVAAPERMDRAAAEEEG